MTKDDEGKVSLVEERLVVEKQTVKDADISIRTWTDTVQERIGFELDQQTIEVTRIPIDAVVETPPDVRVEGDVTIIPVIEERLVVEKRLILVEEVHVRRITTARTTEVEAELRKQRVAIERRATEETGESND